MIPRPPRFEPPLAWRIKSTPRQKILAQWRGVDLTQEEKALAPTGKAVGDVMPSVLKGIGLEKKQSDLEILKVWNDLMDPLVVAHARPVGIAKGTLFVNVDSNAWLSEIVRYRRREILQRLHHSFGPDLIQKISFRVG